MIRKIISQRTAIIVALVQLIAMSSSANLGVETYETQSCATTLEYRQFNSLQPGDEISFMATHNVLLAPLGSFIETDKSRIPYWGTPVRTVNPSNRPFTSTIMFHNHSNNRLLRMRAGEIYTVTITEQPETVRSEFGPQVETQNGNFLTMTCLSSSTGEIQLNDDSDCTVLSLINHYEGVTVRRDGRTLTADQAPEELSCRTEVLEVEEASLETNINQPNVF